MPIGVCMSAYIEIEGNFGEKEVIEQLSIFLLEIEDLTNSGFSVDFIIDPPSWHGSRGKRVVIKLKGICAYSIFNERISVKKYANLSIFSYEEIKNNSDYVEEDELLVEYYRPDRVDGFIKHTTSCVRLIHRPTSISVECEMFRNRFKNMAEAKSMIASKLIAIRSLK
jgi:protein subunit release factor B